jgi:hypothetical protein
MSIKHIVTHPGGAHRDDLLAVCIALSHYGCVPVFRRDPTEEELQDLEVLVLDTGLRHEPERLNFDHHQRPRDAEPTCALALLVQHLGLEAAFRLRPWYAMTSLLDSKGPFVAAKSLGLDRLPEELISPVEGTLLRLFGSLGEIPAYCGPESSRDGWPARDPLSEFLRDLGVQLLSDVESYAQTYGRVRELVRVVKVDGLDCFVCTETLTPALVAAMTQYHDLEQPQVAVSITASDRDGESWALYRYADHPRVDFSRLSNCDQVVFAHVGGFIAKLKSGVSEDEAVALVRAALV